MRRISPAQYDVLRKPLNASRVATRSQGGKQLSYLEAWDVRAHLIRVFGYANFDAGIIDASLVFQRDIEVGQNKNPGWEVAYLVKLQLDIKNPDGIVIASYTEAAVGSATGSVDLGGLHDNALKTAASDALKRCAINLGTQFGLSLYDNGSRSDVVKGTIVTPENYTPPESDLTPEQRQALETSLGAIQIEQPTTESQSGEVIRTPEDAAKVSDKLAANRATK